LKKIALPLLIFSLLLLVLVFVPGMGISAGGAKRWLKLWPSTFQPSELVKLSMVIFLAKYMSAYHYRTDSFVSFAKPIAVMAVFQAIFLKQPDFGAAISLGIITLAMLFFSGIRMRYLLSLSVFAIPVIVKLVQEPYRWKRVTSFLNPWDDPQGSGFQLIQSFIALGSGGIKGVGLGESKQKLLFLPETHTDFIFSLVGEELGLIGAGVIILLFVMLFVRGIAATNKAKDSFVYYLSFGLSTMIALQALINFSVVTGMIPTKGLPLPFISYGGSALLVNMAAVGILLNLSKGEDSRRVVDRTKELVMRKKALRAVYGNRI
ncbi:MAG: putative lipid II flippase FtsW, partial [Thermodesulfovibrionales bacterium]|nr:putative lipid II flippase FtsW [Thermodesulfovibrionales bacterium]